MSSKVETAQAPDTSAPAQRAMMQKLADRLAGDLERYERRPYRAAIDQYSFKLNETEAPLLLALLRNLTAEVERVPEPELSTEVDHGGYDGVVRRNVIEECAAVCDKHAKWAEEKIREDEPVESTGNQIFGLMANTASDCAEMIRNLKVSAMVKGER